MFISVIPDCIEEPHRYVVRQNYLRVLHHANGIPIIVPYEISLVNQYLDKSHGLLIVGGGFTIDPSLFGQEKTTPMMTKPLRTDIELAFFREAYQRKMPILGICGGAQLINVALGGTLYQYLPHSHPHILNHVGNNPVEKVHEIFVEPDTLFSKVVKEAKSFGVNSSHRQAIDQLGKDVRVNARSSDGIIEGIESTNHPFCLGIQWHPEYYAHPEYDPLIFTHFVKACREYVHN